jgi:hypothetical protein
MSAVSTFGSVSICALTRVTARSWLVHKELFCPRTALCHSAGQNRSIKEVDCADRRLCRRTCFFGLHGAFFYYPMPVPHTPQHCSVDSGASYGTVPTFRKYSPGSTNQNIPHKTLGRFPYASQCLVCPLPGEPRHASQSGARLGACLGVYASSSASTSAIAASRPHARPRACAAAAVSGGNWAATAAMCRPARSSTSRELATSG